MPDTTQTNGEWANRISDFDPEVDPEQLLAHPMNARRHPNRQRDALRESLGRVGWVDVVKVNTRTGHVVDGHARVEEAISKGSTVPVVYVDLDEDEERFVLATLDPISAMARTDAEAMIDLTDGMTFESEALSEMVGKLRDEEVLPDDDDADTGSQLGDIEYRLVVSCSDELAQAELLAEFESRGLDVKAQIV